jgi:ferredoxin-NADP reductase/DMSO/TMAO reductase YedYZ heme-binding membrane subunit
MSSSKLVDARFAKWLTIANGLVPALLLGWDAAHHQLGVNEVNFAIRTTGMVGLVMLVLSLLVTPLRRLTGWVTLISVRRNLGVLGFFYICLHFLIFYGWDRGGSVASTATEIIEREYLWYGFGALVLMVPLAITSFDTMVTRLGAKRWKRLHRLAYAIAIGGGVHYYQLAKSDKRQPIGFLVTIGMLLTYRSVAHYLDLRSDVKRLSAAKSVAPPPKKKFWSGELLLGQIFDETADVKTFRFVNPDGGPLPFEYFPGQYLTLRLTLEDGRRMNRSYTIASPPTRTAYCEISVKRAPNGNGGSKHVHDTFREGQRIKIAAPAGKFYFVGTEAPRVVMLAGGIGITPMMSVIRSLTDRAWSGDIYLLYSVRTQRDIAFAAELATLQARHSNLHVAVTLTNDPDTPWDGARGQVSRELITGFVPNFTRGPVMMCGPVPMMKAMRELLVGMGIPSAQIHEEEFLSTPAVAAAATAENEASDSLPDGAVANVAFQRAGKHGALGDLTVLEAAEECGVAIAFECRSGICGQCKTRLLEGNVRMEIQDALTPGDRARGFILACQARAARDIVVDA